MPVVERNISYFFPTSKASRLEAIEQARANRQQWVSKAIVDGCERMKFCELLHEPSHPKPSCYVPRSTRRAAFHTQGKSDMALQNGNPERIEIDANGYLDEVFFKGGVHLERMDKESWYLNCIRENGSIVVSWFKSKDLHLSDREERN